MDFSLNSDQKILRDTVRQFMETEMRPVLRAYEREEKFPAAELRKLGELGCCGMLIPEEWGGAGMDTVSYVVMLEEVARVCFHGRDVERDEFSRRRASLEARHRRAKEKIFEASRERRNPRLVLLDRAAGRFRRGRDSNARRARRRFLRVERDEKLGVERRAHGRLHCVCENGPRRWRKRRDGVFGRAHFSGISRGAL